MALPARRLILPFCLLFLPGCKNCDLVEAELRRQTERVESLQAELDQKNAEINYLKACVDGLHDPRASTTELHPNTTWRDDAHINAPTTTPEGRLRIYGASAIAIGPASGPKDIDRDGIADGIQVVIAPKDPDGDPFKCPGTAVVELFEIRESGVKRLVAIWEVQEDQLRKAWKPSLFGAGYQVMVPWQRRPEATQVRAVVHFRTLDGREFEAERDFQLMPGHARMPQHETGHAEPIMLPAAFVEDSTEPPTRKVQRTSHSTPAESRRLSLERDIFPWPQR